MANLVGSYRTDLCNGRVRPHQRPSWDSPSVVGFRYFTLTIIFDQGGMYGDTK